jgi:polyisoprenoid-binding protein YceI
MKLRLSKKLLCLALAVLAGAASAAPAAAKAPKAKAKPKAAAQAAAPAVAQALAVSGLELSLQGDSTLHKWVASAAQVSLNASVKGGSGALVERLKAGGLENLVLAVSVESLHSPEGKSMDKNMHKAMHAAEHPEIRFGLSSYTLKDGKLSAKGNLEINGTVQAVELGGDLAEKDGKAVVSGSYDLLMSGFGIPPPVMMMGTIRTKDKVTVSYRFELRLP